VPRLGSVPVTRMETGDDLSQSDNPRLAYTDGPSRSKPYSTVNQLRLPRFHYWNHVAGTGYSLLHVQLVIPMQQHVSEMEKPFPS
jgi:hypothetical protein